MTDQAWTAFAAVALALINAVHSVLVAWIHGVYGTNNGTSVTHPTPPPA